MKTKLLLSFLLLCTLFLTGCHFVYINADGARVGYIRYHQESTNDVTLVTDDVDGIYIYWWY